MFHIDTKHPTPLYHQLERSIKFAIATGKLRIGEQLPTVRQLAVDLKINANTVAKVYTELERTGVLETRRGVGTLASANCAHSLNAFGPKLMAWDFRSTKWSSNSKAIRTTSPPPQNDGSGKERT